MWESQFEWLFLMGQGAQGFSCHCPGVKRGERKEGWWQPRRKHEGVRRGLSLSFLGDHGPCGRWDITRVVTVLGEQGLSFDIRIQVPLLSLDDCPSYLLWMSSFSQYLYHCLYHMCRFICGWIGLCLLCWSLIAGETGSCMYSSGSLWWPLYLRFSHLNVRTGLWIPFRDFVSFLIGIAQEPYR